jgi:hypothetical protein
MAFEPDGDEIDINPGNEMVVNDAHDVIDNPPPFMVVNDGNANVGNAAR